VRKLREADIEAYLVKRVEALGGTAEKFSSPARRSVPDRLISWPRSSAAQPDAVIPLRRVQGAWRRAYRCAGT
jgi:hypothetical protein